MRTLGLASPVRKRNSDRTINANFVLDICAPLTTIGSVVLLPMPRRPYLELHVRW